MTTIDAKPKEEEDHKIWFRTRKPEYDPDQKTTTLHFYFHDTLSGSNRSAVRVVPSPLGNQILPLFGAITMVDNPLTTEPNASSNLVGRAQGLYASAGLSVPALLMVMNLYFPDEPYNGSTLALLGRNAVLDQYREMPIVGGSGVFRYAQGLAIAKTYSINVTTGDAIVEYNVTVSH
ncbi:dirigent protein 22-like [Malania oleifera]|uniref:dirigent protein 22-like n=1 Tax=Malania oleifera TaxID=397392 RepID=UPI0025AECDA5|nr:dirigent protein 22-like [Malania oleifera]